MVGNIASRLTYLFFTLPSHPPLNTASMPFSSSSSSSSLPIFLPLAGLPTASSSPPLLRRQCACGEMIKTGGRTIHETAIVRAAHVQRPQHRQWEETMLPTLPCHTSLTLYAKREEKEEDREIEEGGENEPQQYEQEMQQPSSHPPITNTPIKAKDNTTEEDGTYITPRRLPFDSAKQTVPSVLRSSLLKAAAAAAAACQQPSSSSSPPPSPPRPQRPRSRTSSFATATSSSLSSSPKAPRRLPFSSSSSSLFLSDDGE